jgi:hypothetical protein
MKQNFTVRLRALDGVEAFLSVARHRSFRRAAAQLGVYEMSPHPRATASPLSREERRALARAS